MPASLSERAPTSSGHSATVVNGPVLLYDEGCSVCRRFVAMIVNADQRGAMRIAPLQCPLGDAIRRSHPEFAGRDSALWIGLDGKIFSHSDAILASLEYLGGLWTPLTVAMRIVPHPLRDAAYRAFAQNRNLFGKLGLSSLDSKTLERMLKEPEIDALTQSAS